MKQTYILQPEPHPARARAKNAINDAPDGHMVTISEPTKKRIQEAGIYSITHKASGKQYVGSSSNIDGRWRQHRHLLRAGTHPNKKLQNAWSKHGEESFDFVVLEVCKELDLEAIEQRHIDSTDCVITGYNISAVAGRERAGAKHSPEAIKRMSESHRGKKVGLDQRAKLSAAFKGRVFSDETRAKISAAKTGKKRAPFSDRARANMSAATKGRVHSPECRAALSAAHKGKVMSEEARMNMSIAQKKRFANE